MVVVKSDLLRIDIVVVRLTVDIVIRLTADIVVVVNKAVCKL